MKTIKKTVAVLFAVLSFAACTERTIEPAKPVYPLQPNVTRPDTTVTEPGRVDDNDQFQAVHSVTPANREQPGREMYQAVSVGNPQPVEGPQPIDVPRPAVMPVVALDSLAQ